MLISSSIIKYPSTPPGTEVLAWGMLAEILFCPPTPAAPSAGFAINGNAIRGADLISKSPILLGPIRHASTNPLSSIVQTRYSEPLRYFACISSNAAKITLVAFPILADGCFPDVTYQTFPSSSQVVHTLTNVKTNFSGFPPEQKYQVSSDSIAI